MKSGLIPLMIVGIIIILTTAIYSYNSSDQPLTDITYEDASIPDSLYEPLPFWYEWEGDSMSVVVVNNTVGYQDITMSLFVADSLYQVQDNLGFHEAISFPVPPFFSTRYESLAVSVSFTEKGE